VNRVEPKKDWVLTPDAFDQLLQWLDQGTSSSGESYLEMRRRLVAYFNRKHCPAPDELADETLNRVVLPTPRIYKGDGHGATTGRKTWVDFCFGHFVHIVVEIRDRYEHNSLTHTWAAPVRAPSG